MSFPRKRVCANPCLNVILSAAKNLIVEPLRKAGLLASFRMTFFIGFVVLVSAAGCQCVLDVDPKVNIIPSENTHALFINAAVDNSSLSVLADGIDVDRSISFDQNHFVYKKVGVGSVNIKFQSAKDKTILFNGMIDFSSKESYSIIAYSVGKRIRVLIVCDSLKDKNSEKAYIRFVHISQNCPEVVFKLQDEYQFETSSKLIFKPDHTPLKEIHAGAYQVEIRQSLTDSLLFEPVQFNAIPGKFYNILLKGLYHDNSDNRLRCQIVAVDYPKAEK